MINLKSLQGVLLILVIISILGNIFLLKKTSDLSDSMAYLESNLNSTSDDTLSSDLEEIDKKVTELNEEITSVKSSIDDVDAKASDANDQSGELKDKFDSLCLIHDICNI